MVRYLGRRKVGGVCSDEPDQVLLERGAGEVCRVAVRGAGRDVGSQPRLSRVPWSRAVVATTAARGRESAPSPHPW